MKTEDSINFQVTIYDLANPAYRRIIQAFLFYENKRRNGEIEEIFYSREKIAARAKCSVSTVRDFLRWAEHAAIAKSFQRDTAKRHRRKRNSNTYTLSERFYEALVLLDLNNYLHSWKKNGKMVMQNLSEDDGWLCRKLLLKPRVMNNEIAHRKLEKLPTIKSYLKSSLRSGFKDSFQESRSWPSENKPKKSFGILQEMPISYSTKERLMEFYSPHAIRVAVTAAEHLSGIGKDPESWEGFLFYMAKKATLENLNRKTR